MIAAARTLATRNRQQLCAVLAPVFRDRSGELRVLLVRRGARGINGGQLGFPGGRCEARDRSLLETALRETEEEVGLHRADVQVLAPLGTIDGLTSGLCVHAYLARITAPAATMFPGRSEAHAASRSRGPGGRRLRPSRSRAKKCHLGHHLGDRRANSLARRLIELPMLMLIVFPTCALAELERTNNWFARHGRRMLAAASGAIGIYLVVVGVAELVARR